MIVLILELWTNIRCFFGFVCHKIHDDTLRDGIVTFPVF